ncbi:hypothetical protein fugu_012575 [Takifugu bimaculatus]|uniref:Uncharacterized protein n=1 Tax=Takifugu bimaculatus TaxID=433685 RepID=A0A4Z2C5R5_9TELE|nr:hypothetical protein fugu_012575 [Takifugu bimaculatus]
MPLWDSVVPACLTAAQSGLSVPVCQVRQCSTTASWRGDSKSLKVRGRAPSKPHPFATTTLGTHVRKSGGSDTQPGKLHPNTDESAVENSSEVQLATLITALSAAGAAG